MRKLNFNQISLFIMNLILLVAIIYIANINIRLSNENTNHINTIQIQNGEINKFNKDNKVLRIQLNKEQKRSNDLSLHNGKLENTVKKFMSTGKTPKNYRLPKKVSRGSYDRYRDNMTLVGDFLCTYYAPNKKECSSEKGITASGKPIVPGETAAIDPLYWSFGEKFYIESLGIIVEAWDTGSAIKGKCRIDIATLSTFISQSGSFKSKVYLIKD